MPGDHISQGKFASVGGVLVGLDVGPEGIDVTLPPSPPLVTEPADDVLLIGLSCMCR